MGSRIDLIASKTRLDMVCESLAAAYWTKSPYHVERAREDIVNAICRHHNASFDDLVSFIEDAALDSVDLDMTQKDAASAVARALLKALAPDLIEEPAKETA